MVTLRYFYDLTSFFYVATSVNWLTIFFLCPRFLGKPPMNRWNFVVHSFTHVCWLRKKGQSVSACVCQFIWFRVVRPRDRASGCGGCCGPVLVRSRLTCSVCVCCTCSQRHNEDWPAQPNRWENQRTGWTTGKEKCLIRYSGREWMNFEIPVSLSVTFLLSSSKPQSRFYMYI